MNKKIIQVPSTSKLVLGEEGERIKQREEERKKDSWTQTTPW